MIATDLRKQQALDADPKPIQQINFTGSLDRSGNTTKFFIIEESINHFRFSTRSCESIINSFHFNIILI